MLSRWEGDEGSRQKESRSSVYPAGGVGSWNWSCSHSSDEKQLNSGYTLQVGLEDSAERWESGFELVT